MTVSELKRNLKPCMEVAKKYRGVGKYPTILIEQDEGGFLRVVGCGGRDHRAEWCQAGFADRAWAGSVRVHELTRVLTKLRGGQQTTVGLHHGAEHDNTPNPSDLRLHIHLGDDVAEIVMPLKQRKPREPKEQAAYFIGFAETTSIDLSPKELRYINEVRKACSNDETRPTLTGLQVLTDSKHASAHFAATDTHRLAAARFGAVPKALRRKAKAIVTNFLLKLALPIANRAKGAVIQIDYNDRAQVTAGEHILHCHLDGQFPEYDKVIPGEDKIPNGFMADALGFSDLLRAALAVAACNRICLKCEDGKLLADTEDADARMAGTIPLIEQYGEPLDIGLNARYVLDMIPRGAKTITMMGAGHLNPVVAITDASPAKWVIMPMQKD